MATVAEKLTPDSSEHVMGDPTPPCPVCGASLGVAVHYVCDACDWEEGDELPRFRVLEFGSEGDAFDGPEDVIALAHLQPTAGVMGQPWSYVPEFADGAWRMRCNDSVGFAGYVAGARRAAIAKAEGRQ